MKKKLVSLIAFALALVMAMTSLPVGAAKSVSSEVGEPAFADETTAHDLSPYNEPMLDTTDASVDFRTYSRTMDEVRAWLDNEAAMQKRYGNGQCPYFCNHYLSSFWGEAEIHVGAASNWQYHCPPGWENVNVGGNPNNFRMGDLIVEEFAPYGHVMVYYGKGSDGRHYVVDSNFNGHLYTTKHIWYTPLANPTWCFRPPIRTENHYPDKPVLTVRHNYDLSCAIPSWKSLYFLWTSGGSNCSSYDLYTYNADNGEVIGSVYGITANHFNMQLPPGNYKFRVAAVNALNPNVYNNFSEYSERITVQEYNTSFHCGIKTYQGHTYAILTYGGIATADWKSAKQLSELLGGHLPTIANAGENETIKSLVDTYGNTGIATWLGASEVDREGNWQWVTGESFSYTNWETGQPDNRWNAEKYLAICQNGKWQDLSDTERGNIVIEFDYLTSSFPTDEMKTADFNGHTYTLYKHTLFDWYDAKAFCESQGGTLLCIETESEQAFINSFISDLKLGSVFIGATDAESEGNWKWANGEALTYTNWDSAFGNQPDGGLNENATLMMLHSSRKGKWVDYSGSGMMCYIIMEKEAEPPVTEPPTNPPVTEPPITPAPDAPQIIVGSKTATQGSTVTVDVSLLNNPGIVSMALTVDFDERLELASVTDTGLLPGQVHSPTMGNPYVLCWVNDTATENFTADGVIATLTFEVPEDMPVGEYPITISYELDNYDIYNCDVELVDFAVMNGKVNVIDVLIGDVNTDTKVNALDRLYLTRFLAKWADYPEAVINMIAADVNVDTKVNALDRLILTRYLAKWAGYETLPYSAKSAPEAKKAEIKGSEPTIVVDSVTAEPGETVTVCVSLENNPGIVSMMLTVDFDEALELIGRTDTSLLPGQVHSPTLGNPYTLCWVNDTATTNYTVNGSLVELAFKLSENAEPGTYPITITYDLDNYDIYNCDVELVEFAVVNGGVTYQPDEPTTHTVTFIDPITGEVIAEVEVEHGEAAEAPEAPAHEWYSFTGWDADFSAVTEDITVTAQYAELGDVDGNGTVDMSDALRLMRWLIGADELSCDEAEADFNSDGKTDLMDALLLMRHILGTI